MKKSCSYQARRFYAWAGKDGAPHLSAVELGPPRDTLETAQSDIKNPAWAIPALPDRHEEWAVVVVLTESDDPDS